MDHNSTEFNQLLKRWLELKTQDDSTSSEVFKEILELIKSNDITLDILVHSISDLFVTNLSPIGKFLLVTFMNKLAGEGYSYSEYFWVIQKSKALFEINNRTHAGIMSEFLSKLIGINTFRSYLCFSLITEDKSKYESILTYFYPIGQTVSSLKIVEQVLGEPEDDNLNLYELSYIDACWYISNKGVSSISEEDREFFKAFFTRGLSLPNEYIVQASKAALDAL